MPKEDFVSGLEEPFSCQVNQSGGSPAGVHRVYQQPFCAGEKFYRFNFWLVHHTITAANIMVIDQQVFFGQRQP